MSLASTNRAALPWSKCPRSRNTALPRDGPAEQSTSSWFGERRGGLAELDMRLKGGGAEWPRAVLRSDPTLPATSHRFGHDPNDNGKCWPSCFYGISESNFKTLCQH